MKDPADTLRQYLSRVWSNSIAAKTLRGDFLEMFLLRQNIDCLFHGQSCRSYQIISWFVDP